MSKIKILFLLPLLILPSCGDTKYGTDLEFKSVGEFSSSEVEFVLKAYIDYKVKNSHDLHAKIKHSDIQYITLSNELGCYNGNYVSVIEERFPFVHGTPSMHAYYFDNEYLLSLGNDDDILNVCSKDRKIYNMREAFDRQLIDKNDIKSIIEKAKSNNLQKIDSLYGPKGDPTYY